MDKIVINGTEYRKYDHIYSVSRCGKVLRYLKALTNFRLKAGYLACGKKNLVHRMVATCWIDNPEKAEYVHHKDHNKQNNHADNLEWLSPYDHAIEHKLGQDSPSEISRLKLSNTRKGMKLTKEHKAKIGDGSKKWWADAKANGYKHDHFLGQSHTEETKNRMSKNSPRNTSCIVFGKTYPSFKVAGNDLGIRPLTLRKRCLSKNFPDYRLN